MHRATAAFTVAGKPYPAGSYVVKAAQAFRPHLRDMFEPQDHPNDFEYPGGPPKRPYDITGYTLAYQMGVRFDRILDGFDGPFEKLAGLAKTPAGRVAPARNPAGYLLSHSFNDAFPGTAALLASGEEVYWLKKQDHWRQTTRRARSTFRRSPPPRPVSRKLAAQFGLNFDAVAAKPQGEAFQLHPARIGLWDRYGGSMESGHIRWIFEQAYPVPYELVYAPALNAGNLKSKFDVLIFPDGGDSRRRRTWRPRWTRRKRRSASDSVPNEYRNQIGSVTAAQTIPALRRFVEEGGTIVTIGSSTALAQHLGLPVTSALTETGAGWRSTPPAEHQVLRARLGARNQRGQQSPGRLWSAGQSGRLLRQQSGLPLTARRRARNARDRSPGTPAPNRSAAVGHGGSTT